MTGEGVSKHATDIGNPKMFFKRAVLKCVIVLHPHNIVFTVSLFFVSHFIDLDNI